MTWTGRHLDSVTTGGVTTTYEYDSSGMRTTKIVGNNTYEYLYYGGQLVRYSADGEGYLYFYYDDNGSPLGFTYEGVNGTADYYYVLNLQGDVVQLRNEQGGIVANYNYDAWGKLLSVTNASGNVITSSSGIALLNPLRYRGYVYDADTGFYYLQSRYYDPTTDRFISRDSCEYIGSNGDIGSFNLFAYCSNNPVVCADYNGNDAIWLHYDESRGGGYGHAALLVQNKEGVWQYFSWGAKSTAKRIALLFGAPSSCYWESCETDVFLDVGTLLANSEDENALVGLSEYIYIRGDFSASCEYLQYLKTNQDKIKYRLTRFNCVQVCTKALALGTFSTYNYDSKGVMSLISSYYKPEKAFNAWKYYANNIDAYMKAGFIRRFFINNPYKYIPSLG